MASSPQDDRRERLAIELCGLVPGEKNGQSRGGLDSFLEDGLTSCEIKSAYFMAQGVSSARVMTLGIIAKYRRQYFVFWLYGHHLDKTPKELRIAHPSHLEPFFEKVEKKLAKHTRIGDEVFRKSRADDAMVAYAKKRYDKLAATENCPKIPMKLVKSLYRLDLSGNVPAQVRDFISKNPLQKVPKLESIWEERQEPLGMQISADKRCYVSGPYTKGDQLENVNKAIDAGNELLDAGIVAHVPHLSHFWHLRIPRHYDDWMAIDLALLPGFNALLRIPGESKGADMEVERAKELGIPVFNSAADVIEHFKGKPTKTRAVLAGKKG